MVLAKHSIAEDTLSTSHMLDLSYASFAALRLPAALAVGLLALGLPLVMTLAWYHGARASRRISGPELTIISLLLVGISLLFYVFVRPSAVSFGAAGANSP